MSAATIEDFTEAFQDRLLALANTHTLLSEEHWRSASLRRILAAELSPYGHDGDEPRFTFDGENVSLEPAEALALGMAIHELTTNAAKYGALSTPAGRVDVSWSIDRTGAGPMLRLRWVEKGGPPVKPPTRRGFGLNLLESLALGGEVCVEFAPQGLRCAISAPLGRAEK
jgi:two-component sensor histidine kinase